MKKRFNRRSAAILAGIVLLLAAAVFCICSDKGSAVEKLRFVVPSEKTQESIAVFNADGMNYVFLPAYADMTTLSLTYPAGTQVSIDGKPYSGDGFFSSVKTDTAYPLKITGGFGESAYNGEVMFKRSASVAALSVTLIDGTIEDINASSDKSVRNTGTCSVITADGKTDYFGDINNLSGRGNSTWLTYKKPYNLRFKTSTSLLSMKSAVKYCLLANAYDTSSLRNKIAYDAAQNIGLDYSVDSNYVDFYVNGEYQGLYLLTQAVDAGDGKQVGITDLEQKNKDANAFTLSNYEIFTERGENTLMQGYELPEEPDDITGGYLVETDLSDRYEKESGYFQLSEDELFHVKSPSHISRSELDYIASVFAKISKGENLSEIIDYESWTRFFLIKEFFGDTEGSSLYFYKDTDSVDSKVYAGPVWDCDLTMGLAWKATIPPDFPYFSDYGILGDVYRDKSFEEELDRRYQEELIPLINDILDARITEYTELIRASYAMDEIRWSTADKPFWVVQGSLDEKAASIRDYITGRVEFLNSAWLGDTDYVTIHCISEVSNENYPSQYYYTVKRGDPLPELPVPEDDMFTFEGWYYELTDSEQVPADTVVNENLIIRAKWRFNYTGVIGKLRKALLSFLEYSTYRELIGIVLTVGLIGIMAVIFLILLIREIRDYTGKRKKKKST